MLSPCVGVAVDAEQVNHLTQGVFKVVLQKSISTQIRQCVLRISNSKGRVDGFM